MTTQLALVGLAGIRDAQRVIAGAIQRTPLWQSAGVAAAVGTPDLWLKMENMQRTGSFKIRGATYKISRLTGEQRARGVVAASAGNHAQGVALAARDAGVEATIYMPAQASAAKIEATLGYGARVVLEGADFDAAVAAARLFAAQNGTTWISAFDDPNIIAGQGTLGLELLDELPGVETVIIPIGGGGLFAGVAAAIKATRPHCRLVGVQSRAVDCAVRSWRAGALDCAVSAPGARTIADGIAVKSPSPLTFAHLQKFADEMVTVCDESLAQAMRLLVARLKTVAEPSGAAGLAALLEHPGLARGQTAVIICGGNVDPALLAEVLARGLTGAGRVVRLHTRVFDRPGGLAALLDAVARAGGNVLEVHHDRRERGLQPGDTGIELVVEGRDGAHIVELRSELTARGYELGA